MKKYTLIFIVVNLCGTIVFSQKKISLVINDFEDSPTTENWWKIDKNVKFSINNDPKNQLNADSKKCLYVKWDSTTNQKPYTWFTDLKADTMAGNGMETIWKSFQQNTWLSFWCKAGEGDTLLLNYLVLSKGHSSKWGAKSIIPVVSKKWKFYKVRFEDLNYENWGKVTADFDLKSSVGRCFEVGLRSSVVHDKGFIEAWFDNIKLTNFEPKE